MLRSLLNAMGRQTDGMKSKKIHINQIPPGITEGERSDFQRDLGKTPNY